MRDTENRPSQTFAVAVPPGDNTDIMIGCEQKQDAARGW